MSFCAVRVTGGGGGGRHGFWQEIEGIWFDNLHGHEIIGWAFLVCC